MKLKKIDSLNYKCDECKGYFKHKDMEDDRFCFHCYDKLSEEEREVMNQ